MLVLGRLVTPFFRSMVAASVGVVVALAPLLRGQQASVTHGGAWHIVERVSVATVAGSSGGRDLLLQVGHIVLELCPSAPVLGSVVGHGPST